MKTFVNIYGLIMAIFNSFPKLLKKSQHYFIIYKPQ